MDPSLNVTLDAAHMAKLSRLAKQACTTEEMLATSLLSHALGQTDPDPLEVVEILDRLPGAHERALLGRQQARTEITTPLDDL